MDFVEEEAITNMTCRGTHRTWRGIELGPRLIGCSGDDHPVGRARLLDSGEGWALGPRVLDLDCEGRRRECLEDLSDRGNLYPLPADGVAAPPPGAEMVSSM